MNRAQGVNAPSGFIELTVGADTPPRAIDQDRVGVVDVGWRIVSAEQRGQLLWYGSRIRPMLCKRSRSLLPSLLAALANTWLVSKEAGLFTYALANVAGHVAVHKDAARDDEEPCPQFSHCWISGALHLGAAC